MPLNFCDDNNNEIQYYHVCYNQIINDGGIGSIISYFINTYRYRV